MNEVLFSVVIPVVPKHFRYITKLLRELEAESNLIGEVLICASSVNESSEVSLDKIIKKYSGSIQIRIFKTSAFRSAGENRNVGWEQAKFEYISFLDADDIYHPQRLAVISRILSQLQVDALVHDYFRMMPRYMFVRSIISSFQTADTDSLWTANRERMERILPDKEIYSGQSNLALPSTLRNGSRVHHGHLVVRSSVPVRYSSRRTGEDGELVVEILKSKYSLVYISAKLSIYDRLNILNLKQTLFGHIKVRLSSVYRFFKRRMTK